MTLPKKTIPADLYQHIRKDIIYLHLPPGHTIKEIDLSEHYQVSRTPIRQVIQKLISERFILYKKGQGNLVAPLTWNDYIHLYQIRLNLELLSIHLAILYAQREDLAAIEDNIEKQKRIINDENYAYHFIELDREFHLLLAKAGGNDRLYDIITNIYDHYSRYNYLCGFKERLSFAISEHIAIYEALSTKNNALGESEMKSHLENIHNIISYSLPSKL